MRLSEILEAVATPTRYVVTYDYPLYPEQGTDSVTEALNKIGVVTALPTAPGTTVAFEANVGTSAGQVRAAVRKALDPAAPERKAMIACLEGETGVWVWPRKSSAAARNEAKWLGVDWGG